MYDQFVEATSKAQSLQDELELIRSLAAESERNLVSPLRELALEEVSGIAPPLPHPPEILLACSRAPGSSMV